MTTVIVCYMYNLYFSCKNWNVFYVKRKYVKEISASVFQWVFEIIKIIKLKNKIKKSSIYKMISIEKIKTDLSDFRTILTV